MCAVSMVYRSGIDNWPHINKLPAAQPQYDYWTKWVEMLEKARKYDALTNQPDCEDPAKEHILEKVLKRLDELEQKLK